MKPCTIRDLNEVSEVATKYFGGDATFWSRSKILTPENYIFYFDEDLVVFVEAIGTYKYSIHTIGFTRKVKEYKEFTMNLGSWLFDNTPCTCIIAFAASSNKRMQRFIGLTGGKRICTITDGGGTEDEVMYIYPISNREELEARKTCQQQ